MQDWRFPLKKSFSTISTFIFTLLFVLLCIPAFSACQGRRDEARDISGTEGTSSADPGDPAVPGTATGPDSSSDPGSSQKPGSSSGTGSSRKPGSSSDPGSSQSLATPATSGALHVDGTCLVDENGQTVQLKGISTHGLAWYPDYVNEDCFRQLREDWHANVIRLAMYTEEYGGYCSGGDQESLKALVKNGVDYATALDMYVIIDWHILSDSNPNRHLTEAKDFFTEMAGLYGAYNNVLYEICNEPNGNTSWSDVKTYAEEVIPVIRSCDPDGIILVGTPNWSQYVDQAAADPITGYDNIMYTLHFYAATHRESLRNTMTAAIDAGLPVFVSEYGICDASGNGAIDEAQANQWVRTMDDHQVSYVAWNLSNKNETSAILKSDCKKTSGFTEEDLSAAGKWLYQLLTTASSAPGTGPSGSGGSSGTSATPPAANEQPKDGAANANASTAIGNPPTEGTTAANAPAPTATLVNTWESDGKSFYQYELTLQNTSGTDCTQWAIDISFNSSITLSDGWNGTYSISGTDNSILHITNKDYNGSIPAGGSIGNVGFIVSGTSGLEILP